MPFLPFFLNMASPKTEELPSVPLANEFGTLGFHSLDISLQSNQASAVVSYEIKENKLYLHAEESVGESLFSGWFFDECEEPFSLLSQDYFSYDSLKEYVEGNVLTVRAVYEVGHKIDYVLNDGVFLEDPQEYFNAKYAPFLLPSKVSRDGCVFLGWRTELGNFVSELDSFYDFDVTLSAEFAPLGDGMDFIGRTYSFSARPPFEYSSLWEMPTSLENYVYGESFLLTFEDEENARISFLTGNGIADFPALFTDMMIYDAIVKMLHETTAGNRFDVTVSQCVDLFDSIKACFPEQERTFMHYEATEGQIVVSVQENLKKRLKNLFGRVQPAMSAAEIAETILDVDHAPDSLIDESFRDFTFMVTQSGLLYEERGKYACECSFWSSPSVRVRTDFYSESENIAFYSNLFSLQSQRLGYSHGAVLNRPLSSFTKMELDFALTLKSGMGYVSFHFQSIQIILLSNPSAGKYAYSFSDFLLGDLRGLGRFLDCDYDAVGQVLSLGFSGSSFAQQVVHALPGMDDVEKGWNASYDLSAVEDIEIWLA